MAVVVPENLEWSLPVPSVKELSAQPLDTVPPRYIRDDGEDYTSTTVSNPLLQVPVIDMAKLVNPETQPMELQNLHAACRDWGIFQLVNYKDSDESVRNMKQKTEDFFNLSLEEKKQYAQKPSSLEGYGQAFVISEEQKLEWCDMIFLKTLPANIRKLEFWPEHPHRFREALHNYSVDIRKIAVSIVGFIAMCLGLQAKDFSEALQDGKYDVRMNCYPRCPEPERVIGIVAHADNSCLTLLTDCGDTPGLQVLKDGQWVFVEPKADAIVVNTGNIMEIMSNGIYKGPYHRAVVNKLKERYSIFTFCYPSTEFQIGPARKLIQADSPSLYETVTVQEYFHRFYNQKFDGIPFIDTFKS